MQIIKVNGHEESKKIEEIIQSEPDKNFGGLLRNKIKKIIFNNEKNTTNVCGLISFDCQIKKRLIENRKIER